MTLLVTHPSSGLWWAPYCRGGAEGQWFAFYLTAFTDFIAQGEEQGFSAAFSYV